MPHPALNRGLLAALIALTLLAGFLGYRTWTLTAAKNLDSTCAQFNAVKAAWNAGASGKGSTMWRSH